MANPVDQVGGRLKEVRKYLRRTLGEFYSPITKHYNNMSPIENGNRPIGRRLLKDISEHYKINPDWLLTGTGERFLEGADPFGADKKGVPYFNVDISTETEAVSVFNEAPEFYVDFKPFNDCTAYLPVYGDSMYPQFAAGEIIAVRQIKNLEVILWGEAYFVITDETANNLKCIKLIFEHDRTDSIILRSSNPNNKGDVVIKRKSIVALFHIKGKITRTSI